MEKLRNIPLERLTGRQQDELHQIFYKKHAERDIRYMNTRWERPIHMFFESLTNVEEATQSSLDVPARTTIPKLRSGEFFRRRFKTDPTIPAADSGDATDSRHQTTRLGGFRRAD